MADEAIKLGGKKKSIFLDKVKEIAAGGRQPEPVPDLRRLLFGLPGHRSRGDGSAKISAHGRIGNGRGDHHDPLGLVVQHVPALHLRVPHEDRHSPAGLQRPAKPGRGKNGPRGSGSCDMALRSDTCSAMGASEEDFQFVVEDVLEEYQESQPEFAEDAGPINKERRRVFPESELPRTGHRTGRDGAPVENPAPGGRRLDLRHQGLGRRELLHVHGRRRAWKHIVEVKKKAVEDLGCKVWLNTE
jgi:hypothetical protein